MDKFLVIIAAIGFPTVFGFAWSQTQNIWQALGLMVVYGGVVIVVGLVTGVWDRVKPEIINGAADAILSRMGKRGNHKFRKTYLEYLIYRHRTFDVKGLSIQGPFSLELEKVFVDLSISPESRPSGNPIPALHELREGGHSIWKYINAEGLNHLAVLGAPGSGKTTLVKFIALMLAGRNKKSSPEIPDRLPVLLFLRDHAKTIDDNPKVRLTELIYNSLEFMDDKPPIGWFEEYLKADQCLIMLDGLDEVGDPLLRRQVVDWAEREMDAHGGNLFIVTSRPHGYWNNPLKGVTQLEVRPFNRKQVEKFINNWYLANEMMSHQKLDPGVEMVAREGANDLLQRISSKPDIAELAINPLLLTMIANVHRYRSSLPGRRVELYAEMCEVFLGKRQQARNLDMEFTPAQKQSVLQPLAYYMMLHEQREILLDEALMVIAEPLKLVSDTFNGTGFMEMVRDRSGILIERESGIYAFSHKTFQEYFTAVYIQTEKLADELVMHISDDWWHETIRLYCARVDATPVIAACLADDPPPIPLLVLAAECAAEALKVQPDLRAHLDAVIDQNIESDDPQRRRTAAEAQLLLRLHNLSRLDDNTYV
ncbi:MAG: NACHT domain-containing protein [Anaerolineae bacterium]|nr:NACHT domain-containing protein [Anaerolineae bacterium]